MKLIALDVEDLNNLSSLCQDAQFKLSNLIYDKEKNRLILSLRRYRWENLLSDTKDQKIQRENDYTESILHFERVQHLSYLAFEDVDSEEINQLIGLHANGDINSDIILYFENHRAITLKAECIEVKLIDMD